MSVRYIFNTNGEYVAFVQDENLFTPDAEWIGFIRNGTNVYHPDGNYLGQLLNDDRIAIQKNQLRPLKLIPPFRPFKPFRPFSPFRRLRMAPLPFGWIDVFENGTQSQLSQDDFSNLKNLENSSLIGGDGVFLGTVSKNRFDINSMGNQFGNYGSRYSQTSIFNSFSPYGNKFSPLSPFNSFSQTPPKFIKSSKLLGTLTVNQFIANRIDPEKFLAWFEQL